MSVAMTIPNEEQAPERAAGVRRATVAGQNTFLFGEQAAQSDAPASPGPAGPVAADAKSAADQNKPVEYVTLPSGRLKAVGLSDIDRGFAIAIHLAPFACVIIGPLAFIAPIVLWLVRKDQSAYVDDHGREMLNFMVSLVLWVPILVISLVGIPLLLAWLLLAVINPIRAAAAASSAEFFRYPCTFRIF